MTKIVLLHKCSSFLCTYIYKRYILTLISGTKCVLSIYLCFKRCIFTINLAAFIILTTKTFLFYKKLLLKAVIKVTAENHLSIITLMIIIISIYQNVLQGNCRWIILCYYYIIVNKINFNFNLLKQQIHCIIEGE